MFFATALALINALSAVLPAPWLYAAARMLGSAALPVWERKRISARANIQRLHPDWEPEQLNTAVRGVFQETAMYYVDAVYLARHSPARWLERHLEFNGRQHLHNAAGQGKGVILVSGHLSNPEAPFQALEAMGLEAATLVEPLRNRRRMDALQSLRHRKGRKNPEASPPRFLPADMNGIRAAMTLLRRGGVVAILSDRDVQRRGLCVPFAGRQARFPSGAVDLALRTQAALIPTYIVRRRNDTFRVTFLPPLTLSRSDNRALDVRSNLAGLMRTLEVPIREHCDQWRMFESPWKSCRDHERAEVAGQRTDASHA